MCVSEGPDEVGWRKWTRKERKTDKNGSRAEAAEVNKENCYDQVDWESRKLTGGAEHEMPNGLRF